jgi:16S rRNA (guanine527-N7)-methyltransferase
MSSPLAELRANVSRAFGALAASHAAGIDVPAGAQEAIVTWIDLVIRWNARMDLTAARSLPELVDLMLIDGAMLSATLADARTLVDVGTGAGAPGLAIALLRPTLKVTLVEPLAKRVAFLRTVVGTLRATNVDVIRGKGEELLDRAARYDVAVSRATLPPKEWLALGTKLATSRVDVLLAREEPPEALGDFRVSADVSYVWPLTNAGRRAVTYERDATASPPHPP